MISSVRNFGLELKLFHSQESYINYITTITNNEKRDIVYDSVMQNSRLGEGHSLLVPSYNKVFSVMNTSETDFVNAILMNKYFYYKILNSDNIPFPNTCYYSYKYGWLSNFKPEYGSKVLIKLSSESCSIGLTEASVIKYTVDSDMLIHRTSLKYMQPVIIQEFIEGLEVEIPVIVLQENSNVLNPVVIEKEGCKPLFYDVIYDDNYSFSSLKKSHPMYNTLVKAVKEITKIIGIKKYFRVDCIVRENDFFILDINTYPHIIKDSSFGYAFDQLEVGAEKIIPLLISNQLFDL